MIAAWSLCTEVLDQSTRALFFERVLIARNASHQRIFSLDFFHVAFQFVCGFRHFDAAHILFCSKLIHYDFLKSVGLTCSNIRHYEIQKARKGLLNALRLCLSPGILLFPTVGVMLQPATESDLHTQHIKWKPSSGWGFLPSMSSKENGSSTKIPESLRKLSKIAVHMLIHFKIVIYNSLL